MVIEFFVVLKICFIIAIDLKFGYSCCIPRQHSDFYLVLPLCAYFDAEANCFSHFFTPKQMDLIPLSHFLMGFKRRAANQVIMWLKTEIIWPYLGGFF